MRNVIRLYGKTIMMAYDVVEWRPSSAAVEAVSRLITWHVQAGTGRSAHQSSARTQHVANDAAVCHLADYKWDARAGCCCCCRWGQQWWRRASSLPCVCLSQQTDGRRTYWRPRSTQVQVLQRNRYACLLGWTRDQQANCRPRCPSVMSSSTSSRAY